MEENEDRSIDPDDFSAMQKVRNVILYMGSIGLDLPTFLDAVSWGSRACMLDGDIKAARTLSHEQ